MPDNHLLWFGKKNKIRNFLISSNLRGVDRIVPIGQALEMDITWDGYNLINSLTREITDPIMNKMDFR